MTREQMDAIRARHAEGFAPRMSDAALLLAEVERLTADPLPAAAWVREVERAAFQRGVAAMRKAAVVSCLAPEFYEFYLCRLYAAHIRDMPSPEDTP